MLETINKAINMGADLWLSVSGGKDGQAMTRTVLQNGIRVSGMLHCDLGHSEWPQSLFQCQQQADEYGLQLHVLRRKDGLGLVEYIGRRMRVLAGTGKPFWPSSAARYCTSDLKREPSNHFFRNTGSGLIISAEGLRAQESPARAKKDPLSVRPVVTSDYYSYVSGYNAKGNPIRTYYPVEDCLQMYKPSKRLVLNWYPVLNMFIDEVWGTYGMSKDSLHEARNIYQATGTVPEWWPFHPAYAFGNDRVSCMICILGSPADLMNGARHNPDLLNEMIAMEQEGGATFKNGWSLKNLLTEN
jgi:3'-phosphoadenosine 5'-phosphosulfate sulfotransferase (PAPS reductase)/FAD synthetase